MEERRNSKEQGEAQQQKQKCNPRKKIKLCFLLQLVLDFPEKPKADALIYCSHSTVQCAFIYFLMLFSFFPLIY